MSAQEAGAPTHRAEGRSSHEVWSPREAPTEYHFDEGRGEGLRGLWRDWSSEVQPLQPDSSGTRVGPAAWLWRMQDVRWDDAQRRASPDLGAPECGA